MNEDQDKLNNTNTTQAPASEVEGNQVPPTEEGTTAPVEEKGEAEPTPAKEEGEEQTQ